MPVNARKVSHLISYIEQNFINDDKTVNEHFFYIKSLLKQSLPLEGEEANIAKICEAIHYIETMKIKVPSSIFYETQVTMAELMSEKGEIILPAHEREQKPINLIRPIGAVSANAEGQFGSLHNALVKLVLPHYQFLKEEKVRTATKKPSVVWEHDYPRGDDHEVMNQAIGEWQAQYIEKNTDETKADRDFKRDISIRGITATTDKEVDDLLEYLLEGSDYPKPSENDTIKQWLRANGGQDINRFLDTLMLSGEFTPQRIASLLNTKGIEQGWTIENGKATFFYTSIVYSLNVEGDVLVNDGTGKLLAVSDPENIKDNASGNYRVLPIMAVKAKIELNVNAQQQVTPSVTALSVASFSPDLAKPQPKVLNEISSVI